MKFKCSYYIGCRNKILEPTQCNEKCELYKLLEKRKHIGFTVKEYHTIEELLKKDKQK